MTLIDSDTILFFLTASIEPGLERRRGDFMATVKVTAEKQLEAEYRFRWWVTVDKLDMDGGSDDDEKSFYAIGPVPDSPENRQKLFDGLRNVARFTPGFANVHEQSGEWTPEKFVLEIMMNGPMRTQLTREEP